MTAYAHLLLYFFFYSFVGWIWESSYVSILTKRLTTEVFNWSNASDLWKRRCSHALCHLPGAIVPDIGIFLLGLMLPQYLNTLPVLVMETLFQVALLGLQ